MKKHRFRNWLRNKILNFDQSNDEVAADTSTMTNGCLPRSNTTLDGEPIHLNIYTANGGMVVETKTYDRQRDRNNVQLYIVNSDEDLGDQLSKIITMVSLGR